MLGGGRFDSMWRTIMLSKWSNYRTVFTGRWSLPDPPLCSSGYVDYSISISAHSPSVCYLMTNRR